MGALRIAVVGSGPAGAFCAQILAEEAGREVAVDVFERLPAPFGLVRYGVAPDHKKIKSITASLGEVFDAPGVRFLGNVTVGADVTIDELRAHYDAVVLASGAPLDRRLGVEGEQLAGVVAARDFVSWYSGHPDAAFDTSLLAAARAVVVGVGNVALDVARMLVRTPDELRRTDVPAHVIEALAGHAVREVCIVGRRGPDSAKFTNKELVELGEVEGADVIVSPEELELSDAQQAGLARTPAAARLVASLRKLADREPQGRERAIRFLFNRTPVGFVGDASAAVTAVRLARTTDPAVVEELEAGLVLPAVGYRSVPMPGVPFDESTGTIPHRDSRVVDGEQAVPGLYVVGWAKRGPSGVIGTNRLCASETAAAILADADALSERGAGAETIDELLRSRGVAVVDWSRWLAIEAAELKLGEATGRERVKLHDRADMLTAAGGLGR
ncbi:FAD-dependent oxidoreductase [Actinospica durhamensis]|uniref:ferredoxin--NADP(+) reductase n=1 Tax=Actinospica durhamensis TaxID=1508375 RepID=A0A941EMI9_9ACTN|nr:FAD-dependent oxidoreductase [Actinospica durhamensis]MBR7833118.1 FAD-dependent oxidoreductase [Actinospica durhamensis]